MDLQFFMQHLADYGISYGTIAEFNFRHNLFKNLHEELNEINNDPTMTSTVGHNFLSTWTDIEKERLNGHIDHEEEVEYTMLPESNQNTMDPVDHRDAGWVNPVQDQAQCGSCWAFSTICSLEGQVAKQFNELLKFSEQQLVSCDTNRDMGCSGGNVSWAYKFLESTDAVFESKYGYTSGHGTTGTCDTVKEADGCGSVVRYANVAKNNSAQLVAAVGQGVVSVAIQANKRVFQNYTSGVIQGTSCGHRLDHAVAVVGLGTTTDGIDYYIVRNSWGPSWGDHGYVKMAVEAGVGVCGIQKQALYVTSAGDTC